MTVAIKKRFYTANGKPLRCTCGCNKLQKDNEIYDENGQVESFVMICSECKNEVGAIDNNQWDKSYIQKANQELALDSYEEEIIVEEYKEKQRQEAYEDLDNEIQDKLRYDDDYTIDDARRDFNKAGFEQPQWLQDAWHMECYSIY